MITVFYFAIALATGTVGHEIKFFGDPQAACRVNKDVWKLGISTGNFVEKCCIGAHSSLSFVRDCKFSPESYGCDPLPPTFTRLKCVAEPSYRLEVKP